MTRAERTDEDLFATDHDFVKAVIRLIARSRVGDWRRAAIVDTSMFEVPPPAVGTKRKDNSMSETVTEEKESKKKVV